MGNNMNLLKQGKIMLIVDENIECELGCQHHLMFIMNKHFMEKYSKMDSSTLGIRYSFTE